MLLSCPYCQRPLRSTGERVAHLANATACPKRRSRAKARGGSPATRDVRRTTVPAPAAETTAA